jgi:hypothetical protein
MTLRQWTGTPFGPDSIAGTLWAGYEAPRCWSLTLSFLFVAQGELSSTDIFDTDDYRSRPEVADVVKPPTGMPTYTSSLSLKGTWSPYPWLHLMLQPGYRLINNYAHVSGKTEHGFELALSVQVLPGR